MIKPDTDCGAVGVKGNEGKAKLVPREREGGRGGRGNINVSVGGGKR